MDKKSKQDIKDVFWTGVFAAFGGMFIEIVLVGSLYLFEPTARRGIDLYFPYVLLSIPVIFVAAFGISLQLSMKTDFWRGKWN